MEFVKRIVGMGAGVALIPVMAVAREARDRKLGLIRLDDQVRSVDFGIALRKGVSVRTVELLKSFCLEVRGPELRHLTIESIGKSTFRPVDRSGDSPTRAFAH
jgi:DNA-binding transcriptional LysR family regulator